MQQEMSLFLTVDGFVLRSVRLSSNGLMVSNLEGLQTV